MICIYDNKKTYNEIKSYVYQPFSYYIKMGNNYSYTLLISTIVSDNIYDCQLHSLHIYGFLKIIYVYIFFRFLNSIIFKLKLYLRNFEDLLFNSGLSNSSKKKHISSKLSHRVCSRNYYRILTKVSYTMCR